MEKTTNIRNIASRIMRHPLLRDVPFETILEHTLDFIQIVGYPSLFEEKTTIIKIKNWRGILPCDYISMLQVKTAEKNDNIESTHRSNLFYRYSTDTFHISKNKLDNRKYETDLTYKIQGNVIYTSTKDTDIEIAYNAIATDKEGYPLLPDNSSFLRALESYVKKQQFTVLFDLGKLPPAVLQNAQQEYAFYVGQCQNDMVIPSIDQMEALTNMWTSLIARVNEHSKGFVNLGSKEYLNIQP